MTAAATASRGLLIAAGVAAVAIATALSLAFGSRTVTPAEITEGLSAWLRGEVASQIGAIAVQQRIPRTVLALAAGAALALSGALMQAVTRNPIADPGILGVNMGAALFVVCGIAFLGITSPFQYLGLALAGAALAALFVYVVGSIGAGGSTPIKLALAGAATSAALSSLVSAVLLPRVAAMNEFRFWQVGGVGGADWSTMAIVAPLLASAALVAFLCAPGLNALALGDDVAVGLGVRVGRTRAVAATAGVVLCAAVTAVAGPIAFVGLMVPHVVRLLSGPDQRWLLPLSALGGAVLLAVADTIGRVIGTPGEVEAGIVTAFVGAPVLVVIARRTRMRAL
ncbi:iron chelate uptake ABC transporter family permease subunit [Microbacterium oryzae]|uniref:FecCD family ABC transporter permease n=1 Tax=Microbacterium oryzae TaxID=743009 RepID=UPI0025AF5DA1|nr:iron chelate uptake ABC transporter family permease subunit [Microbacterium oryzae]MDN3310561.1 iron chelate uptake ABC transporter family permease subunit [Microbacterium oryzae]